LSSFVLSGKGQYTIVPALKDGVIFSQDSLHPIKPGSKTQVRHWLPVATSVRSIKYTSSHKNILMSPSLPSNRSNNISSHPLNFRDTSHSTYLGDPSWHMRRALHHPPPGNPDNRRKKSTCNSPTALQHRSQETTFFPSRQSITSHPEHPHAPQTPPSQR
jgi:hypothetical protein